MTDLIRGRKTLEQKLLPNMFFEEKANMLNAVLDKEGKFFTDVMAVYLGIFDDKYRAEDIKVYLQRAKSEEKFFDFVMVRQPECKEPGIADTLYFCFEETTGSVCFFAAENGFGGDRILIETDGKDRADHGRLPDDADKEFQKAANIFIRRVHGAD